MKPSDPAITIDKMTAADWPLVREIYQDGLTSGHASFETKAPSWENWNAAHLPELRFIARDRNSILGWAALSPVSNRCIYGGVAEVSVYVATNARKIGVGKILLETLIAESERAGLWTLQAGIFPENEASVRLHLRCGFREVGRRERIGQLRGVWRDTLLLERRSARVGIN